MHKLELQDVTKRMQARSTAVKNNASVYVYRGMKSDQC